MEAEDTPCTLYIPEGLLTDSFNKLGRNNKGAVTKPCCLNKFLTVTVEPMAKQSDGAYRFGEGRVRSDPEVSEKQSARGSITTCGI